MVPPLDDLAGAWLPRAELAHLPSLRNQWGQAHANADLTSLSWLAIPPFSGGYHTGVLRLGGRVIAADTLRWAPWGVQRRGSAPQGDGEGVVVTTDTRLGYESASIWWRVELRNTSDEFYSSTVEQELLGAVARSEVDWGWLYGTPWNSGHHHDYYTTERIRTEVLASDPRQVQLVAPDLRLVRLGSPRIPGIQRDEDSAPMLLESELPDHSTADSGRTRAPAAVGTVRYDGQEYALDAAAREHRLAPRRLAEGETLIVEFRPAAAECTGVVLTHGNHPDSLQLGLDAGRPWLRVAGERVVAAAALPAGGWHTLAATVSTAGASLLIDGVVVATTSPWWSGTRWRAARTATGLRITDTASDAWCDYAFATAPDEVVVEGGRAFARWRVDLAPGESLRLGTTIALAAQATGEGFDAAFDAIADRWRATWAAAFTPGNDVFSGHLPTLATEDAGLARTYYLGALLAIYLRNTGVSPIGPVFLTGGPRLGPTTTFYWDQSEWARTGAMLEPAGVRAWILAALAQPYGRSHSFDTRNLLPVGNHYASNDHALFRIVQAYVGVTGDLGVLGEKAGTMTVLDHLHALVAPARAAGGSLVDFGDDAWELLECVPNYRHAVVSFNAGYVGMLRDLAELHDVIGEPVGGLREEAAALAAAVRRQYAGNGRWRIAAPGGDEEIGHVLDFVFVAAELADDLSATQRDELVSFVVDHLLDGDWMRALDPQDPVAPYSDRPDHGAAGAFGAWPGATAYGLCQLGRPDLAQAILSRAHAATSGGLWGQAMEAVGGGHYRVAERGVSNRDSNCGVAFCEAVIGGLFGVRADFASLAGRPPAGRPPAGRPLAGRPPAGRSPAARPHPPATAGGSLTSAAGQLYHVNAQGFDGQPKVGTHGADR